MESCIDLLANVRDLIGTRYEEATKEKILEALKEVGVRIVAGPHDITTKDMRSDRVMVSADDEGIITALNIR